MAISGTPFTLPLQILPPFLLAIGVCAAVHILVIFFRALHTGRQREEAIAQAFAHSALPVVMAALTTAGGLVSFVTSDLKPVAHFGIFGPVGVLLSLFLTLVLLPALLAVIPLHAKDDFEQGASDSWFERILCAAGEMATRHPRKVVLCTAVLLGLAAWGASRLEFSHHPIAMFPQGDPSRKSAEFIDRTFQGSINLEVLLETDRENGLHDPELLRRIDELQTYTESIEVGSIRVGKAFSIVDILKETHQALNENRADYFTVPDNRQLIAQELLLFENAGSDDLEDLTDSHFSMTSFSMRIPWVDGMHLAPFIDEVEAHFNDVLGGCARVRSVRRTVRRGRQGGRGGGTV